MFYSYLSYTIQEYPGRLGLFWPILVYLVYPDLFGSLLLYVVYLCVSRSILVYPAQSRSVPDLPWSILAHLGPFWSILVNHGLKSGAILVLLDLFWSNQVYPGQPLSIQVLFGLPWSILAYPGVLWSILIYLGLSWSIQVCSGLSRSFRSILVFPVYLGVS